MGRIAELQLRHVSASLYNDNAPDKDARRVPVTTTIGTVDHEGRHVLITSGDCRVMVRMFSDGSGEVIVEQGARGDDVQAIRLRSR